MYLYANGCSFTTGYGSEDTESNEDYAFIHPHAWPQKLCELMGLDDVFNHGLAGGSNDRILRTTIDWILNQWIGKNRSTSDLTVIVGWTDNSRREFLIDGKWVQIIPYHNYPKSPEMNKLNKIYRSVAWSEEEASHRFAYQLLALQSFLCFYDIRYFFFDAFMPSKEIVSADTSHWENYKSQIDKTRYYGFDQSGMDMRSQVALEFPKWKKRHPSKKGHLYWAQELNSFIEKKIKIK
ncbi:MAG: DUF6071 family protein [Bacteroidota bacterium]